MLAELPPAQLRALYPDRAAFAERHPEGEADAAEWSYGRLKRVLADVRARGWAAEDGEVTSGLASAGAAVVDHLAWPAAAIAVTFPDDAAISCDAGENRILMTHFYQTKAPGGFLQAAGSGPMGFGIPAALAAKQPFPIPRSED